jgi:hypothetical protein
LPILFKALSNRGAQLASCAQSLGLQYSHDKPASVGAPFFLVRRGAFPLKDAIWGDWRGLRVRYADYRNFVPPSSVVDFSVVCADLSIRVPYIQISKKGGFARLAKALGARQADLVPERFSREFRVKSKVDQFARTLIDADMMAWLISSNPKLRFEMAGSRLVVSRWVVVPLHPSELPSLLDAAVEFAAHIPKAVLVDYSIHRGEPPGPR